MGSFLGAETNRRLPAKEIEINKTEILTIFDGIELC